MSFPLKPRFIIKGFSMAMLNNQRVYIYIIYITLYSKYQPRTWMNIQQIYIITRYSYFLGINFQFDGLFSFWCRISRNRRTSHIPCGLLEHVGDTPGWPRFGKPAISVGKLTYFHGGFSTSNCKRLPFPVCYWNGLSLVVFHPGICRFTIKTYHDIPWHTGIST
jgi:hypothetical protein